ncbi:MAG: hypothetical protein ABIS86_22625, partial [Streptosporangiaceae bacterium]
MQCPSCGIQAHEGQSHCARCDTPLPLFEPAQSGARHTNGNGHQGGFGSTAPWQPEGAHTPPPFPSTPPSAFPPPPQQQSPFPPPPDALPPFGSPGSSSDNQPFGTSTHDSLPPLGAPPVPAQDGLPPYGTPVGHGSLPPLSRPQYGTPGTAQSAQDGLSPLEGSSQDGSSQDGSSPYGGPGGQDDHSHFGSGGPAQDTLPAYGGPAAQDGPAQFGSPNVLPPGGLDGRPPFGAPQEGAQSSGGQDGQPQHGSPEGPPQYGGFGAFGGLQPGQDGPLFGAPVAPPVSSGPSALAGAYAPPHPPQPETEMTVQLGSTGWAQHPGQQPPAQPPVAETPGESTQWWTAALDEEPSGPLRPISPDVYGRPGGHQLSVGRPGPEQGGPEQGGSEQGGPEQGVFGQQTPQPQPQQPDQWTPGGSFGGAQQLSPPAQQSWNGSAPSFNSAHPPAHPPAPAPAADNSIPDSWFAAPAQAGGQSPPVQAAWDNNAPGFDGLQATPGFSPQAPQHLAQGPGDPYAHGPTPQPWQSTANDDKPLWDPNGPMPQTNSHRQPGSPTRSGRNRGLVIGVALLLVAAVG